MRVRTSGALIALAAGLLAGSVPPVAAQESVEPLITDRPDFTESPQNVPKGRYQLEGGYTYSRTGAVKQHDLGEILLRIGSGERTEVRVGLSSYSWIRGPGTDTSGFQDTSIGMKFHLADGSEAFDFARPAMGVIVQTTLPTGNDAFGANALQPEAVFSLAWDLNERWSMATNLNYGSMVEDGDRFGEFSGSLSFAASWNEKWGSFFEVFGFAPESRPNTSYFNTGVTYLVHNDYQLDFRVGTGLNGQNNDYFIGVGAARRW